MTWFTELLKQPWFYPSPSPWSMVFYVIMTAYGVYVLRKEGALYKHKRLTLLFMSLDSFFIFAIMLMIQDFIWLCINTLRFWPEYASMMSFGYFACFGRDAVAAILFGLLVSDKFGSYWKFSKKTLLLILLYTGFVASVAFLMSTDPAMMDWTYAIRYGYSDETILVAFVLSHIVGKIIIGFMAASLYIRQQH